MLKIWGKIVRFTAIFRFLMYRFPVFYVPVNFFLIIRSAVKLVTVYNPPTSTTRIACCKIEFGTDFAYMLPNVNVERYDVKFPVFDKSQLGG
jgi:hypothetical protein